jgi:hypothetical protein
MVAAFMQFLRHGGGIHALFAGGGDASPVTAAWHERGGIVKDALMTVERVLGWDDYRG